MNMKNCGTLWTIDHCYPLSESNSLNEKDKLKQTHRIILRPMCSSKKSSKGDKTDHRIYQMQETKAYQFIKLNGEVLNKDLHKRNIQYFT